MELRLDPGVFPIEEWFEVRHDLDLDNDLITLTIAGNVVGSFTFDSPFGGVNFSDTETAPLWEIGLWMRMIVRAIWKSMTAPKVKFLHRARIQDMDPAAFNYDATAGCEEECIYLTYDCASIGYEAWSTEDMGLFDWQEATHGVRLASIGGQHGSFLGKGDDCRPSSGRRASIDRVWSMVDR